MSFNTYSTNAASEHTGAAGSRFARLSTSLLLCLVVAGFSGPTLCADGAKAASDPALIDSLAKALATEEVPFDRFEAEVWLQTSDQRLARYVDDPEERLVILQNIYQKAHQHDLDPDLILALMHVESFFDRYAISRVGAQGLMQVMPFWRLEIGRPQDNLTSIDTNIRYGTAILAHYIDISNGDLVEALGRYNGSKGRLKYPELVVSRYRKYWRSSPIGELPHIAESCRNYSLKACR
ncbi:MAG: lytic transglycosylase domain-containing protein [Pseudomonadaceae bacterium]|nr:lytic transglycosylase domain-containing protein [Pseudomonadaceae bacterium]